jgi:uncharacterized protein
LVSIFFEGKMLALLGISFGAGIVLFLEKEIVAGGVKAEEAYIRRQLWFIAFGLFTAFIILWPDELMYPFGIVGILLFAFWKIPAKGFFIAAFVCLLIYSGKAYWNYAEDESDNKKYLAVTAVEKKFKSDSLARAASFGLEKIKDSVLLKKIAAEKHRADSIANKRDTLTNKQAEEKENWEAKIKSLAYDSAKTASTRKAMRAPEYSKLWFTLKGKAQNKESVWLYSLGVWDIASMFFLGMALFRLGFFSKRYKTFQSLFLSALLIGAGMLLGWMRVHENAMRLHDYNAFISSHALPYDIFFGAEKLLMATGYSLLVMGLVQIGFLRWIWVGLSNLGRMALTNYILQALICTFWFYGYGLGFYGMFKQWELYFIVAEITLVQAVFSVLWLRKFYMGPVEWLLACLYGRKWLPLEKKDIAENASNNN